MLEENLFWDEIRNPSEEVSENLCTFCSHSFELISSGLNTSYRQTGQLQWLFNTTSNRVANKPKACFELVCQLVQNQRPLFFSPLILLHSRPELSRRFPSKPLLSVRHLVKAGRPEVLPRCDTSSSPALHNARTIQFHRVHPSSFPTGRLPQVYAHKH